MRNNYDNETLNSIESKKMVQLEILEETPPEVTTNPGRSREVIQQVAVDEWPLSFLGSAIAIAIACERVSPAIVMLGKSKLTEPNQNG